MPFKSEAQRRYMYAQIPEIAKRWEAETPDKKLPKKLHPEQHALKDYLHKQKDKKV